MSCCEGEAFTAHPGRRAAVDLPGWDGPPDTPRPDDYEISVTWRCTACGLYRVWPPYSLPLLCAACLVIGPSR